MTKFLMWATLASSLLLGACATTGGSTPIDQQIIADVQAACGFSPAVATIDQILVALFPNAAPTANQITQIITTICAKVTPPSSSSVRRAAPYYPGTHIRILGTWVR